MSNEVIGTFIFDGEFIIVKEHTTVYSCGDKIIEIVNTRDWLMEGEEYE